MASVCRSLQCLISALTQAGGGGLLFRGRGAADKCHLRVWGGPAVSGHTGFAPLTACAFPVYAAQAPGCPTGSGPCAACGSSVRVLHKSADSAGPAFCVFPARAAQAARSLMGALSPVRCAFSPPPSQPQFPRTPVGCALCLFWGAGL